MWQCERESVSASWTRTDNINIHELDNKSLTRMTHVTKTGPAAKYKAQMLMNTEVNTCSVFILAVLLFM